jgi:hypothetical protein
MIQRFDIVSVYITYEVTHYFFKQDYYCTGFNVNRLLETFSFHSRDYILLPTALRLS